MRAALAKFVRDLLTEKDNQTWCLVRVTAAGGFLNGLGLQAMAVLKGGAFDFKSFCEGMSLFVAGLGAAIAVKTATKGENGQ